MSPSNSRRSRRYRNTGCPTKLPWSRWMQHCPRKFSKDVRTEVAYDGWYPMNQLALLRSKTQI
jgi:hypothetical protein